MRKKSVLIAIASAISLAVLIVALPLVLPTSLYRGWFEARVWGELGARVQTGKIRFQLVPYPKYAVYDFDIISTQEPFQGLPIFSAKKVTGDLSLAGILQGRIVTRLKAEGATVDYRMAEGKTNVGMAFDLHRQAVPGGTPSGESVLLRSALLSKSRIDVWESGAVAFSVDGVELSAKRLGFTSGVGFDLRMTGVASEPVRAAAVPDAQVSRMTVGIDGRVLIDTARMEIASRALKAALGPAQVAADFSINYGAMPMSFDIHIATPDLGPGAASPLVWLVPAASALPAWEGPLAADVLLKGTREACDVSVQIDATAARIAGGPFFIKGAGLPFKALLSIMASPSLISIQEGTISMGQDTFSLKGEIDRDENATARLNFGGMGLNDSTIRVFFPRASAFDEFADLGMSVSAQGALKGLGPLTIAGTFKAAKIALAGIGLTDVEGSFEREIVEDGSQDAPSDSVSSDGYGSVFRIPLFRAAFAGGSISGNGYISLDSNVGFSFDAVGERLDAAEISSLGGLMAGEASAVVKAQSKGVDSTSLTGALSLAGSLLIQAGSFVGTKPAAQIFSADTWKWLGEQSRVALLSAMVEKLSNPGDEATSFNAAFELAQNQFRVSEVSWGNPQYEARFALSIDQLQGVAGEGSVLIPKAIAVGLVPAASHRILLDGEGKLILPVTLTGKLKELVAKVDRAKLGSRIEAALALAPVAAKQGREAQKPAVKAAPKGEPGVTPKREKPLPKQSEEDVLNVIIGQ